MEKIAQKFYSEIKSSIAIASFEFAIYKCKTIFVESQTDKEIYKCRAFGEANKCKFIVAGSKKNVISIVKIHKDTGLAYGIVDNDNDKTKNDNCVNTNRINLEAEMLNIDNIQSLQQEKLFELFLLLDKSLYLMYEHDAISQLKKPNPSWRTKELESLKTCKTIEDLFEKSFFHKKTSNIQKLLDLYKGEYIYASKYIFGIMIKDKETDVLRYFVDNCDKQGIDNIIKKINELIE